MSHLTPFIAIALVILLVSDRGLAAVRSALGAAVAVAHGVVEHVRALGRRNARLALGP